MRECRRLTFCLLSLAAWQSLLAADYVVTPDPVTRTVTVELKLEGEAKGSEFRMPAWAPGDYQLFNYGKVVTELKFLDGDEEVPFKRTSDPNVWVADKPADSVVYVVKESRGNFTDNLWFGDNEMFISGPGVFGWVTGHVSGEHSVTVKTWISGQSLYAPLRVEPMGDETYRATAKSYDVLLDSPLLVSDRARVATFLVGKKQHRFIGFGRNVPADLSSFVQISSKAVEESLKLFGSLPYDDYTFFGHFGGFPAGLEHASSTRIGLWSSNASQASGLIFHEFLHAYNVKVIRPKNLGPFDYSAPAVTGTLWWLEGVTDYYASLLEMRGGLMTKEQLLADMANSNNGLLRSPGRLRVTLDQSSRRVWEVTGSGGFGGVSYYAKGRVVGFLLDLAIRRESSNKHSLDDVIRTLYAECLNKEGYAEGRIRELVEQFGGKASADLYDLCVMSTDELPFGNVLRMAGFSWDGRQIRELESASDAERAVAQKYPLPVGF